MKTYRSVLALPFLILLAASLACSALAPKAAPPASPTLSAEAVAAISAGAFHICQLTKDGKVFCWGANPQNQLGDGTTVDKNTPVSVSGLPDGILAISAGGAHTCALTPGGGVKCWGDNSKGQLGDGTKLSRLSVVDVTGLSSGVTAISAGSYHTCALTSSGGVKCWGQGLYGRLGDGKGKPWSTVPVDVVGLDHGVTAISAGDEHSCALLAGGSVQCWGKNSLGELGIGEDRDILKQPGEVTALSGVTSIAAAYGRTCAVAADQSVACWGWDGLPDYSISNSPRPVIGLQDAASVTSGLQHSCALTSGGEIYCWGSNEMGQLGNGTTRDSARPVRVEGLHGRIISISAGFYYTCALTTEGSIQCWGSDIPGQLSGAITTMRLPALPE
jgi:alpha-tubulin suppressor-like RCC1 family protein